MAAPFLDSVVNRGVKAQAAVAPKRLIIMFTHYGCITTRFFPDNSHGPLTGADLKGTTLEPLIPYVAKMLMPRGIRSMNEWTTSMDRGQGNDPFLDAVGSYFTCQPVTPNSNDPFSFDMSTKFNAQPVGPSLDHVIAQQLSPGGTPLFMHVGGYNDTPASGISYSAAETMFPGFRTAAEVFTSLTGLLPGGDMSADSYQAVRGQSVIDIVRDDLDTLERFDMSQADRNKLDAWKTLLDETSKPMVSAMCNQDVATMLELTQANVGAANPTSLSGTDPLTTKITASMDGADVYSNLAVLAAVCNANPVILMKYPPSYVFKGLGIQIESTSLSHRGDNASMTGPCYPDALNLIHSIDQYYASKFAHLVDLLSRMEEGDATVLDNSATIWFQEVSDGNARNLNNLPIVQMGSLGGYFKTGWAVNVEDGAPDLTKGNSEAQCASGTSDEMYNSITQQTGTDPKLANAPINSYYCTLMNALGVKGGDDGFPAKDGSGEVAKFGMYDRTEDFVGGGTVPPMIHYPGEYTALKATS